PSFALLERNIRENGFGERVILHPCAASDTDSELPGVLISGMFVAGAASGGRTARVKSGRVDDVIDGPMDLVKLDIEGHEPAAVAGMAGLLRRHRPVLLCEANEYWLRTCSHSGANEFVGLLCSLGYDVYGVAEFPKRIRPGELA